MQRAFDPNRPLPADTIPPVERVYVRIFGFMRQFWRGIALMVAFSMMNSALMVLQPWPIKFIIDGVLIGDRVDFGPLGDVVARTHGEKIEVVLGLVGAWFVITVTGVLLSSSSAYLIARTALYMIHTLRSRLVSHMRALSLRFHANQSVGDSIWRAINDARGIQDVMLSGLRIWAILLFRLVLMVTLMLLLDPLLTLVALVSLPLLAVAIRRLTSRIQQTSQEGREHMSRLTSIIEQTLGAIRAVQVFGKEGQEAERFRDESLAYVGAQLRFRVWEQVLNVCTVVITGLGTAAVLLFASERVISGQLSVGSLYIFISYMSGLYDLMNQIMFVYAPFQDAVVGVGRAFQVLDIEPDIREAPDATGARSFERSLRFRNVAFAYDAGRPVLAGIDIEVRRGEKVALVGETGCGKTTLLSLLPRLYDPVAGAVELDGVDVRQLKLASLRDLISMVPQEPLLFSTTVRENILYGRFDATADEVRAAAKAARASDFIEDLPQKYETQVGDRGVKLSTGQQQRISIARAFLKDAPILLLDEPTSALDLRTEADFLDGLEELMAGRTVFIVAHRLSTIRNVDRIYLLKDGAIAEEGSHAELMARRGGYYALYTSQFNRDGAEPAQTATPRVAT